ncbi:MAG: glycosyltransferase family 4 protein [Ferrimicrobium sp.]
MMTVAVEATALLGMRSGVGEFAAGLLYALAQRDDVEAGAFAVSFRGRHRLESHLPSGVTFINRPIPARPAMWSWRRLGWPSVDILMGGYRVVHGTNFVVPPAKRLGRVVTVHDLTPLRYPEYCHPSVLKFPVFIRRAIAEGAWVHTPSEFVRSEVISEFGADADRVVAIPHGIPGDWSEAGILERPPEGYEGIGSRILLALSTLEPRKGVVDLLRAFDTVAGVYPDVELWIAGGRGWGLDRFDAVLDGLVHRDRVRILGYVDVATRRWLLTHATLFVYPSHYEGFGLPPLEAMAAGTPVVTTDAGAIPEVVGDAARVVPARDSDALASAVVELLEEPEAMGELVSRGTLRAASFRWENSASAMIALYHRAEER